MKKIILSICLLTLSMGASAQKFTWGGKVSVSSPDIKIEDFKNVDLDGGNGIDITQSLGSTNAILSYQLGLFARVKLAGFYIQPELMLSNSKTEIKFLDILDDNNDPQEVIGEVKLNKIDLPILVGKRFLRIFRINAGPVFSLLLSQNIDQASAEDTWSEIEANYKNATVGLQYGLGVDIYSISIDLRVEKGFQSISENLTIGGTTFEADQRLEQIMLSVGLTF